MVDFRNALLFHLFLLSHSIDLLALALPFLFLSPVRIFRSFISDRSDILEVPGGVGLTLGPVVSKWGQKPNLPLTFFECIMYLMLSGH